MQINTANLLIFKETYCQKFVCIYIYLQYHLKHEYLIIINDKYRHLF